MFRLPPGPAEALLDRDRPGWTEPLVRQILAAVYQLGAVIRPHTLADYATKAGFAGAEPLEVADTGLWRVHHLGLGH